MFVWAHRGASVRAPENTLAAFRAAEAAGADGIELDVHLCADGVPVVIHDETLERTTDGRGPVAAWPLAKLRQLDAGGWFAPEYAGEPLPTLEEVLAWAGERLRLNVEIKAAPAALAVLELLRRYPRARVLVSSFDHRLLARLRGLAPELPLGFLLDSPFWRGALRRAAACRAQSLHPRHDLVCRPLLAACRRHGLAVHAWTVDDPRRLHDLRRLGVDGVFTNDPAAAGR
jgi:glycerophosphoryl diester phosphodiesterase